MRKRLYVVASYPYAEEDSVHPPDWKEAILEARLEIIRAITRCVGNGCYFAQAISDESAALFNDSLEKRKLKNIQKANEDAWIQSEFPLYELGKTVELLKILRLQGYNFFIKAIPWDDLGNLPLRVADDRLVEWVQKYGSLENTVWVAPWQKLESLRLSSRLDLDWYYIGIYRDNDAIKITSEHPLPLRFANHFKNMDNKYTQGGKKLNLELTYCDSV